MLADKARTNFLDTEPWAPDAYPAGWELIQ